MYINPRAFMQRLQIGSDLENLNYTGGFLEKEQDTRKQIYITWFFKGLDAKR
jgi:hypothetical protein